ncbi:MAG: peptidoglycan editing factor PgeF [Anaerolineae bacterium]|nr:peptidoglycan editing factor PgeF [Phycisphaerae bacterium]
MLQRRTGDQGVVYYASPLLQRAGVPHAFSTRIGGMSSGPFTSLNLGNPSSADVRDDADHIAQNYRRLHAAIGCENRKRCFVKQVHGCAVLDARAIADYQDGQPADALTSDDPTKLLAIQTADCIPILLATTDGKHVAAIHAGWRGIIANIIAHAGDEVLRIAGSPGKNLIAAIGPCIGKSHFEVGPEVLAEFDRAFERECEALSQESDCHPEHDPRAKSSVFERRPDGKGNVDLPRAAYLQLLGAGLSPDSIDTTDRCTFRDADEFFSHRRDRGVTGRMAALIGVRDPQQRT